MASRTMSSRDLIAWNVRRVRMALGMTQSELAKEMRIQRSRVSEIEKARFDCSTGTIDKLCDALHVSQQDLFRPVREDAKIAG